MNEQLENSENDFLWKLLANPADPSHSYIYNLQLVVNDHPQSGLLRALLVPKGDEQHLKHAAAYFEPRILYKMASNLDGLALVSDEQIAFVEESTYVPRTYVNPMAEPFVPPIIDDNETNYFHVEDAETPALDEPVETPAAYIDDAPAGVSEPVENEVYEEIAPHDETPIVTSDVVERPDVGNKITEDATTVETENTEYPWYIDQPDVIDEVHPQNDQAAPEEPVTQTEHPWYIDDQADGTVTDIVAEKDGPEEEEQPADDNLLAKEYEEHLARLNAVNANVPYYTFDEEEEDSDEREHIDEEVYDEIVSIEDIGLEQLAILNKATENETASGVVTEVDNNATDADTEEAEKYFAEPLANEDAEDDNNEDDAFRQDDAPLPEIKEPVYEPAPVPYQPETATAPIAALAPVTVAANARTGSSERISRYNDEKMPYSFMWWLDKTRKEHADKYQPYTGSNKNATSPAAKQATPDAQSVKPILADELQQQYFENIFNANSIHGLDPLPPQQSSPESAVRKEDKIIERFIQEEPQIKHPSTVKLNNENKAKKSSEDRDELVTETLAKIYTEQMLYQKAINTYKKLMLKYPEKSLYFAGQIEQLENKIN